MTLNTDNQGKDLSATINTDALLTGTIQRITETGDIEAQWRNLEKTCNPSFFTSWSWIGPWANLIKNTTELFLFSARKKDTIIAMCFLTISKTKRLKGLIHVKQVTLNDYLNNNCNMIIQYNDMLAKNEHTESAWRCLYKSLMAWDKKWDELAVSSITEEQLKLISDACPELHADIDRAHKEWTVTLSPEFSDISTLIAQFKAKSRRQLRQSIKNFEKEIGPITITTATSTSDALDYFGAMEKLHTKRWEKVGVAGSFANKNWVNFHKEIIRNEFKNGKIIIFSIKSGEQDIGYLYGHVHNNVAYMQQTGFASLELNILKPGYISHVYAMSVCADRGIKEYNLLPDEESSYKKFFAAPGQTILWINFQKNSAKLHLEKYIRRIQKHVNRNKQTSAIIRTQE